MMSAESITHEKELEPVNRLGVICVLVHQDKIFVSTLPAEDFVTHYKSEKSPNQEEYTQLEAGMLSLVGGQVEATDIDEVKAMLRELEEELGLQAEHSRLKFLEFSITIDQIRQDLTDPQNTPAHVLFSVVYFSYELTDQELEQIQQHVQARGRTSQLLTREEFKNMLQKFRPSTQVLVDSPVFNQD